MSYHWWYKNTRYFNTAPSREFIVNIDGIDYYYDKEHGIIDEVFSNTEYKAYDGDIPESFNDNVKYVAAILKMQDIAL